MALRLYLKALGKHWWELLSCAAFTILSVVAAIKNWSNGWVAIASIGVAAILLLVASGLAWNDEYKRAEAEKAKNEAAPHMDISVLNAISYGAIGKGITDLFFYLRVVLTEPSMVSIRDCSLTIIDQSQSQRFIAIDDADNWEVMKSDSTTGGYSHVHCVPLLKELANRGEPVHGWIHISLPGIAVSFVQHRTLTIEINGLHGTCYSNLPGAMVHSDPDVKGVMRKISDEAGISGRAESA
jgi:hypothetical protein